MDKDDIIYLVVLISCMPLSYLWRLIPNPAVKQLGGGALGLLIATVVCGWQLWHSLVTAFGNYAILKLVGPRYCHLVSFIYCFGYLAFFRLTTYFNLDPVNPHTNVIQLVLTVKMVSLAMDVHDDFTAKQADKHEGDDRVDKASKADRQRRHFSSMEDQNNPKLIGFTMPSHLPVIPSPVEFVCFTYCFVVLLTGPFYRLSTYRHGIWRADAAQIPTVRAAVHRLRAFPLYVGIVLVGYKYFPHKWIASGDYLSHGLLFQLAYLIPAFIVFRVRYYVGWSLAEAACIMSGIGAYPVETDPQPGQGPTTELTSTPSGEFSFRAVQGIDVWAIEAAPDMRTVIRNWNMTVQWWMTYYIYKRFPFKSLRYGAVFLVSAYWHGIAMGYYLCFMSTILTSFMETRVRMVTASLRKRSLTHKRVLHFVGWLLTYRLFEYLSIGFMLQLATHTFHVWWRTYFFGHVLAAVIAILTFLAPHQKHPKLESKTQ